jgi:dTDP-4-dehydrorhamnose reductase
VPGIIAVVRLLVIGATGYVGRHVVCHASAAGLDVSGTSRSSDGAEASLDVTDIEAIGALTRSLRPDVIINAAMSPSAVASTSEFNWAVNAVGAVNVARVALEHCARLVHISSDAVFSGREQPYTEADQPDPIYPYGAAKAAADLGVATVNPAAAIVRPSLITADGDDLSRRERHILDLAAGRVEGAYFTDEVRCPVGVNDLARACLELAAANFAGVLNVTGPEPGNLYDFAVAVARRHGADARRVPSSDHASAGVHRPGHVVLDVTAARSLLCTRVRGVSEILARPLPS